MARWQKPYLDVPADDYLSDQDLLLRWGYPLDHVPDLHELIGPHEQRYMNLMRMGRKPVCMLDTILLPYWEEEIAKHNYGVLPVSEEEVVIHLPSEKWRAEKIVRIRNTPSMSRGYTYHVKLGYLLGYTKTCIAAFCIRMDYILNGQMEVANSPVFQSVEAFEMAFPKQNVKERDDVECRLD